MTAAHQPPDVTSGVTPDLTPDLTPATVPAADVPAAIDDHQPGERVAGPQRVGVPRTRIGGLWVASVLFALVLLLLLIFVLQNGQRAEVSFLGAHGHLPMGVALLLAAVFGILLVALPGTARIVQLRLLDRRRGTDSE